WEKAWEFVLPADTLSALLIDPSGEGQLRLVTLHPDGAKEDVLHLRIWKREGERWQQEWQTTLEPSELRGVVAGNFVQGSKGAQVITPRNLILLEGGQYRKRTRKDEVNWFASVSLREGEDMAVVAYPGGVWRGVLNLSSRDEWLRFERQSTHSLLSLPQQFGGAHWVNLVTPLAFREMEGEQWTAQGYDRLFAQMGKAWHPDEPLLVTRTVGEGKQALALVVPPGLNSPLRTLWQSEPIEGNVKEVRLVSMSSLRGGMLVLVGKTGECRVQFWQAQREEVKP
ncbi:MAG: hypothetical protein RMM06_03605, partial [Armatimonadota bacterium]|nr:hypothetical protein [Armatimonadota bacterium]